MRNEQLTFWNPWVPSKALIEEFFGPKNSSSRAVENFNPAVDVEETENGYLLSFDLPGIKKDELKIEVVDNELIVSGERKFEKRSEKSNQVFVERSFGTFERRFSLPNSVDTNDVHAQYTDGVLRVTLAKAESVKPRQIKIQ